MTNYFFSSVENELLFLPENMMNIIKYISNIADGILMEMK